MLFRFQHLLAPPVFPDDALKTRRARLLDLTLLVTIALGFLLVGNLLGGRTPILILGADLGLLALGFGLRSWAHHGHVQWAGIVLLGVGWVGTTLFSAALGTIRTPTTALYLLLVVVAGQLFDVTGILATTLLSSLAILGLIGVQNAGWLPPPDYTVNVTQWISYTALIGLAGGLTWTALQSTRQNLRRAEEELAERQRAQEELQKTRDGLQEAQQFSQDIIAGAGEGIAVYDRQLRYVVWNHFMENLTGVSAAEVVGQKAFEVFPHLREQGIDRLLERALAGELVRSPDTPYQVPQTGKSGWVVGTYAPHRDAQGHLIGVVATIHDISERKWVEETLQKSEQYARSIINSSLDMIVTTDTARRIVEFNRAAEETFGYRRAEVLGKPIELLYAQPEESHAIRAAVLQEGKFVGEIANRQKNGEVFPSLLSAATLRGTHGEIWGTVGVSRDFTERKCAEDARRQAEEKYRLIVETAVEGIFQSTREGRFLTANPALARMWGYASPEELITSITDVGRQVYVVPQRRADYLQLMDAQGQVQGFEFQIRRQDGRELWVSENAHAVHDDQGAILYFEGTVEDITTRKAAEEALRESEERFAGAFEYATTGMALVSPDGHWQKVNRTLCELTGYPASELLSKSFQDITHPDDLETDLAYVRQMLAGEIDSYQLEKRYLHKRGHVVWILLSVSLVRDGQGHPLHFVAQVQNITGRKQAEAALQRRASEFAALYDITRDLAQLQDLPTVLQTIAERATTLLEAPGAFVYLYDPVQRNLDLRLIKSSAVPLGTRLEFGEGMAGRVAQSRQPLIIDDYQAWEHRSRKYDGIPFRAVLEVPMLYGGEFIGVVAVNELGASARQFTEADARLLSLFAGQAASAVYNARLLEETRQRTQRQEALYRISTSLTHLCGAQSLCETVVQACGDLLGYPFLGIFLVDPGTGDRVLHAQRGWDDAPKDWRLHPGEGLSHATLLSGHMHYYPDVTHEPNYVPGKGGYHSEVDVPIKASEAVLGVLIVEAPQVDAFDQEDFDILRAVANQLAVALENACLFQDTQNRLAQLTALQETTKAVVSTLELDHLLHRITLQASTLLHGDGGILNLVNWEIQEDEVVTANGSCGHTVGFRSSLGDSLSGWVTLHNQPVISNQLQRDDRVDRYVRSGAMQNKNAVAAPLTIKDHVIGTLVVLDKEGGTQGFDQADMDLLSAFANQAATAIENARLYEAAQRELAERQQAQEALVKRTAELEHAYQALQENQAHLVMSEKMASLGRLTAGIAHEMNTPLATVRSSLVELRSLAAEYQGSLGNAEVTLEDHRQIVREMEQMIKLAETAAERAAAFVRGIKAQTRALAASDRQRFDALPIIHETLLLLSHALKKAGCTVEVESAANRVELYGSPGRLSEVVTNLVTNAIDASGPKGGGPVTLRLTPDSHGVDLEVRDAGCGIPAENLPRIFDPLFTTKPFGQGTGLGLSIVREIVTGDFGGQIEVSSQVDQGTTIRVHFPTPKEET